MPRLRSRAPIAQPAARARALTVQAAHRAARARIELAIVIPLIVALLLANEYRQEIFGLDTPVRVFTAIALLILGWRLARDVGRTLAPQLFKRMDPATAGTVGFLIRLGFLVAAMLVALRIAGLEPRTLAVSGAIVAVIFGCTRRSRAARTRSWCRTTSCSHPRSCRCASRRRSTCARGCART
jgi:hypothetical protein